MTAFRLLGVLICFLIESGTSFGLYAAIYRGKKLTGFSSSGSSGVLAFLMFLTGFEDTF
jgi:hypothetical protein